MSNTSIETLKKINTTFQDEELTNIIESARIESPAKEIENALTSFIIARFEKLQNDMGFNDLIKMHIRQRLAEATFDQLIQLHREMSQDDSTAIRDMLSMFKSESTGKILTEHLRDSEVSSTAQKLYDSTDDKKLLQAVGYLSQVLSQFPTDTTEAEEKK